MKFHASAAGREANRPALRCAPKIGAWLLCSKPQLVARLYRTRDQLRRLQSFWLRKAACAAARRAIGTRGAEHDT